MHDADADGADGEGYHAIYATKLAESTPCPELSMMEEFDEGLLHYILACG